MTRAVRAEYAALLRAVRGGLALLVTANGADRAGHGVYTVPSGSRAGRYLVRATPHGQPVGCTCEQWAYRGQPCKHMAAVWLACHPTARVKLPIPAA